MDFGNIGFTKKKKMYNYSYVKHVNIKKCVGGGRGVVARDRTRKKLTIG